MHNGYKKECAKYGIRVENNFLEIEELLEVSTIQKADMMHDSATISERIEDSLLYMFLTKNSFIHGQSSMDFHEKLSPYFRQEELEKELHCYAISRILCYVKFILFLYIVINKR